MCPWQRAFESNFEKRRIAISLEIKILALTKVLKPIQNQPLLTLSSANLFIFIKWQTLLHCLKRTKDVCKNESALFTSSKEPVRKSASTQTLSRLIKNVLCSRRISTEHFSAYSTRHASAFVAKQMGVCINAIRPTAGWTKRKLVLNKSALFVSLDPVIASFPPRYHLHRKSVVIHLKWYVVIGVEGMFRCFNKKKRLLT